MNSKNVNNYLLFSLRLNRNFMWYRGDGILRNSPIELQQLQFAFLVCKSIFQ